MALDMGKESQVATAEGVHPDLSRASSEKVLAYLMDQVK